MLRLSLLSITVLGLSFAARQSPPEAPPTQGPIPQVTGASPFVPNQGQWDHAALFVRRASHGSLFVEPRGFVLGLRDPAGSKRGVGLRLSFEGDGRRPSVVGESALSGHHDYFLGADESKWRTEVPLFASVRYRSMYEGVDVRLRQAGQHSEYDVLLEPYADLSQVVVRVDGARSLQIAPDGSLAIDTELGTLTQPRPKTWQTDRRGQRHAVECEFVLLDEQRYGFRAPSWDTGLALTVDPPLLWGTYLGRTGSDMCEEVHVADSGLVTVAGRTTSPTFPIVGGYRAPGGSFDLFISRFDPAKTGSGQLVYSMIFGGSGFDTLGGMQVEDSGVVTLAGYTTSKNLPTTASAYSRAPKSFFDTFVCQVDPRKVGAAQLLFSTYLGGNSNTFGRDVAVRNGLITVVGTDSSTNFPVTANAYNKTKGSNATVFLSQFDPTKSGAAQLVYSSYLAPGYVMQVDVSKAGVVTLMGNTGLPTFPITTGAYQSKVKGDRDLYVTRIDPSKSGAAQLVYSTFLGGNALESADGMHVGDDSVITVAGFTRSGDYPTTANAYDRVKRGTGRDDLDGFVSRLDPRKTGAAQLVYSTFFASSGWEVIQSMAQDDAGRVTIAGRTDSKTFPTTAGAVKTKPSTLYTDAFVARLDPSLAGKKQLLYSTLLGGTRTEHGHAVAIDGSGTVFVAGETWSTDLQTTSTAYQKATGGGSSTIDGFLARLQADSTCYADRHALPLNKAGSQTLNIDLGTAHANETYAVFGSATGTSPATRLFGIDIPLVVDPYTEITIAPPASVFRGFRGTLDAKGTAQASIHVPSGLPTLPGLKLYHAAVVVDSSGVIRKATNAVPLRLY